MFDISFGELLVVFVLGLIVLGPQRLPVAVKTVVGWIRALRSLATSVQHELAHELKLQELQDSLKKVEKASMNNLTPELKASMDELREATESMKRAYSPSARDPEQESDEAHTIHHPATAKPSEEMESAAVAEAHPDKVVSSAAQEDSESPVAGPPLQAVSVPEPTKNPEPTQPLSEKR
ncbi:Sec-independent protein translocase protein TatB [Citrobacter sp. JGM124]|uniref:Sec-independent protein translocase protein TatB n=1 Tax=Citrobacter sp. JGM124 TaxID=2799789 RepID=UPI001BA8CF36|nr:Sec-independent protein translocase subunit TatB [Citrobacter sp. JGM124]